MSERDLPIYPIEGTDFLVDVRKGVLKEKANPANEIHFNKMSYRHDSFYEGDYDLATKNLAVNGWSDTKSIHVHLMVMFDPEGMAERLGLTLEQVKGKTDFDLLIDQELFSQRINQGRLPVLEIMGHPFYVDVRMESLRPHDDFSTMGIKFSDIDNYMQDDTGLYQIPYDPVTHTFKDFENEFETMTEIPDRYSIIEFAPSWVLDPVGYAREIGVDIKELVMENPLQEKMMAKIIPVKDSLFQYILDENKKKLPAQKQGETKKKVVKRKKGKGI